MSNRVSPSDSLNFESTVMSRHTQNESPLTPDPDNKSGPFVGFELQNIEAAKGECCDDIIKELKLCTDV